MGLTFGDNGNSVTRARNIKLNQCLLSGLTVSIGIAGVSSVARDTDLSEFRETLLRAADLALYDAKGAGRNNVRIWQDQNGAA